MVDGQKDRQVDRLIHVFSECLLRVYSVPDTVLGTVDTAANKI